MKLKKGEVKKALNISKTIQHYIDMTGDTNLRSTDVFPELVRKGIFEPDRHNGIHFRRFLYKLEKSGELKTLIPQCAQVKPINGQIFSEWYFHCAKDKMPKPINRHQVLATNSIISNSDIKTENFSIEKIKEKYTPMHIEEAIDIVKMLIAGVNPITERPYDNLGVCSDITVVEALKTIITPEAYNSNSNGKIKKSYKVNKDTGVLKKTKPFPSHSLRKPSKFFSATVLGKLKNKNYQHVISIMCKYGLIENKNIITPLGKEKGIKFKQNGKGDIWIVYPESLAELL